jgi:hypothetical protein
VERSNVIETPSDGEENRTRRADPRARRGTLRAASQPAAVDPRLHPFINALAELLVNDLLRYPPSPGSRP